MKINVYYKRDKDGRAYYSWDETDGGYYNLEAMMALKNLRESDANVIYPPLTAYKITYSDGTVIKTSTAADVTLGDAEKYFIGARADVGSYPIENVQVAVKVEAL